MRRLILLGGPPGIGKSAALGELGPRLPKSGLLEADDVWRVSADVGVTAHRSIAHENVNAVLRGYFEAGCENVVIAWVFARPPLYEPVIDGLADIVGTVAQLYLVATAEVLVARLEARFERQGKPVDRAFIDYSLGRLEMVQALPYARIDTSALSPSQVADEVVREVVD